MGVDLLLDIAFKDMVNNIKQKRAFWKLENDVLLSIRKTVYSNICSGLAQISEQIVHELYLYRCTNGIYFLYQSVCVPDVTFIHECMHSLLYMMTIWCFYEVFT